MAFDLPMCVLYAFQACMGVPWAMALIDDTKEAKSEEESGLIKTRLTRQAAMAL